VTPDVGGMLLVGGALGLGGLWGLVCWSHGWMAGRQILSRLGLAVRLGRLGQTVVVEGGLPSCQTKGASRLPWEVRERLDWLRERRASRKAIRREVELVRALREIDQ